MGLSNFGANDGQPITLKLPESVPSALGVYYNADGKPPISRDDVLSIADAWLERNADDNIRSALMAVLSERSLAIIQVHPAAEMPPPPMDVLHAMGLGETEEERLIRATHVVAIGTGDMLAFPRIGLTAVVAASRALALHLRGIVFDPECRRVVPIPMYDLPIPKDAWLPIGTQIVVQHSEDDRGKGWMTTVGMGKYGLPNLELRDIPPSLGAALAPVICAIAHRLVLKVLALNIDRKSSVKELIVSPEVEIRSQDMRLAFHNSDDPDAPKTKTLIRVGYYPDQEGKEKLLGIMPPIAFVERPEVWMYRMLRDLAGEEDVVKRVSSESEMVQAAHLQAISELPTIKDRFAAGLPPGAGLFIKHGFHTATGDLEFMWFAVQTWTEGRISGLLANESPSTPEMVSGASVEIAETDVFDWCIAYKDGYREGAYTTKAIKQV